ncbi:HTH_Tnp_Tc3_2 domain-containing protein [Trichonephila clavipes]|nr:HTH_Tnp_Tc3_2 domain-containing protein [Trichonephila clavipes]
MHALFNFRYHRKVRNFQVNSVKSELSLHGWWKKISDRAKCKEKLSLNVYGNRRLRRIVRSQRRQTLAQINTKWNNGVSRTVNKRTVKSSLHRMSFGSRQSTGVPLLNARHRAARLAWARKHIDWILEDWKRVAWSDESRFRLFNAVGKLRIWRLAPEAMSHVCQVGIVQGHGLGYFFVALLGIFGVYTNHPQCNSVRKAYG